MDLGEVDSPGLVDMYREFVLEKVFVVSWLGEEFVGRRGKGINSWVMVEELGFFPS
tara:strand:+ start:43 stop:210 length:168 start_codon:yes stop_codon:yes gene_type:complete